MVSYFFNKAYETFHLYFRYTDFSNFKIQSLANFFPEDLLEVKAKRDKFLFLFKKSFLPRTIDNRQANRINTPYEKIGGNLKEALPLAMVYASALQSLHDLGPLRHINSTGNFTLSTAFFLVMCSIFLLTSSFSYYLIISSITLLILLAAQIIFFRDLNICLDLFPSYLCAFVFITYRTTLETNKDLNSLWAFNSLKESQVRIRNFYKTIFHRDLNQLTTHQLDCLDWSNRTSISQKVNSQEAYDKLKQALEESVAFMKDLDSLGKKLEKSLAVQSKKDFSLSSLLLNIAKEFEMKDSLDSGRHVKISSSVKTKSIAVFQNATTNQTYFGKSFF